MEHVRHAGAIRATSATVPAADAASGSPWKGLLPCLFYLFIEFARPMAWFPALDALRPGLVAGVWGLAAALTMRSRPLPRIFVYMLGFQALLLWHVYGAVNNFYAFQGARDFAIILFGCVLPLAVLPRNLDSMRILLTAYVFFHVPTAINGILHGGRGLGSWMGDENDLALALNAAVGIAFYLLIETRSVTRKLLLAGSMAVMVGAIVATLSRGGFVGLAALGLYMMVFGPKRQWVVAALVVALVALVALAPATWWAEMGTISTADQEGDTGSQRYYFWGIAWKIFLDHPIAGAGTLNYGIHALNHHTRPEMIYGSMWLRAAHSLYFTLLAEQGIVGVLLFLLVITAGWRAHRRHVRGQRGHPDDPLRTSAVLMSSGMTAGAVTALVTGIFLSSLYYPVIWILAGLVGSLQAVAPKDEASPGGERRIPASRRFADVTSATDS